MARIQAYPIAIPSGRVWIFDPYQVLGTESAKNMEGLVVFTHPYVAKDGSYAVCKMRDMYFVNVHPQTLRAKNIPDMNELPDRVPVDCSSIGFIDSSHSAVAGNEKAMSVDGVLIDVEPGEYNAWVEQKGDNYFRGVIGFGKKPVIIVNGESANDIADLEKLMVQVMKKQGDYSAARTKLSESIMQMHQNGCKDKRLKQLADALGLKLPRRKPNKSIQ